MTLRSSLALALVAGIAGAFIGRAIPRAAPSAQPGASVSTHSATILAGHGCKAERAELASTKAQLAICAALVPRAPETAPPLPEPSEPDPEVDPTAGAEENQRNRELLDSYSEAVIVQLYDGRTGVYKPDEWPIDGDGVIIARKLPSGEIGWYAGPDAGPRSDPAAFRPPDPPKIPPVKFGRLPDGTITINGKPASPSVQRMFGGTKKE